MSRASLAAAVGAGAITFGSVAHAANAGDFVQSLTQSAVTQLMQAQYGLPAGVGLSLGAPVPVTDYIAVSSNTTTGQPTQTTDALDAMAVGPSAIAAGSYALAVGSGAAALRNGSTAVGSRAAALGANTTVIGYGASTGFTADRAVSIGYMSAADGTDALAFGSFSAARGERSTAIGANAYVNDSAKDAIALGAGTLVTGSGAVALGANATADRANTVSVGNASQQRQIVNVAAGTADTDAVNVAQLKAAGLVNGNGTTSGAVTYDKINGQTGYSDVTLGQGIAGGTVIHNLAAGVLLSDAVNLGQLNDALGQVVNVQTSGAASAFVSINGDSNLEAAQATGTHAAALGPNAVANGAQATAIGANAQATGSTATALGAQAVANGPSASAFGANSQAVAEGAVALGAGSIADRANSVSVGVTGAERQIVNVAPGTRGTDAVNLNQLNAAFNQANQSIHDLDTSTRKGIASASALQIVTPYLPGRTTLNAGIAGYRGQAALGLGVSRWNDKGTINFNAGVASSGSSSTIVRAGIGIVLGD